MREQVHTHSNNKQTVQTTTNHILFVAPNTVDDVPLSYRLLCQGSIPITVDNVPHPCRLQCNVLDDRDGAIAATTVQRGTSSTVFWVWGLNIMPISR